MKSVMSRFDDEILAAFHALVDASQLPPGFADALPFLTFAVFNGLAIGWSYDPTDKDESVLTLLEMAAALLPALRSQP